MVTMTLHVDGMMCGMCESHMQDVIRNNFNVKKVKASHSKNLIEIMCDRPISEEELHKVIDPTGYELKTVEVGLEKKTLRLNVKNKYKQ